MYNINEHNMRKYFVFLLAVVATLVSCDCSTTNIIGSTQQVVNVVVNAQDWQYTAKNTDTTPYNNNYFFATIRVPEITDNVFDYGEVQAYIVYDRATKDPIQHLLPYVRHYEEQLDDTTWNYYTETVDCTYGIGWVEFNYRASDFAYEDNVDINPNSMDFRIVITTPAK